MHVATAPAVALPVRLGLAAVLAAFVAVVPAGAGSPAAANPTVAPGSPSVTPAAVTPQQKAEAIVDPAVVYLEVRWQGWVRDKRTGLLWDPASVTVVSRCTGFAVSNDGYIVTAGRCVDPGVDGVAPEFFAAIADRYVKAGTITAEQKQSAITDMIASAEVGGEIAGQPAVRAVFAQRGVAKSGLTTGDALPAKVVSFQPVSKGDVGLVKIEKSNQPMVTLADPDVKAGTEVLAIGYPALADSGADGTLEPSTEDGKIGEKRTQAGVTFYQTTAMTQALSAGGPAANLNGDVVGLVSHAAAAGQQTASLLAATPVISQELAKAGVKNELGKIDKDFRRGLSDYYAGRYTPAIEAFDQVLAAVPSHAQAQDYRQQAVSLRTKEGDPAKVGLGLLGSFGTTRGLLLVGAIVVVIISVVLLLVRRKRTPPLAKVESPAAGGPIQQVAIKQVAIQQVAVRQTAPALTYCSNCSRGWPPATLACATCGQQFE